MIADLKPYPRMKDSGVPWLGSVPEHWAVRRLRHAVDMRVSTVDKLPSEGEMPVRLCNYVDVYKHDRITADLPFMLGTASPAEIERFRLDPGDVLITKDSETWNDIGVPALVEVSADDLICGYHLAILRAFPDQLLGEYLFRAVQSQPLAQQFHREANGVTRYGLTHGAIKSVSVPLPTLSEQAMIVRFLDYADRRITCFIRAKQKLIKLLEEQKQAIIHRAVTRGLNPAVRLKPSDVEWVNQIPEHWETRQLKQLLTRMDYGTSELSIPTGQIRVLTMGNIQGGEVTFGDLDGGLERVPSDLLLEHEDLLFTRTNGNPNLVGKVGLFRGAASDQVSFASYLVRLRVLPTLDPRWLHQLLNSQSFWSFARSHALVNLQTNLSSARYGQFKVPVPPPNEQREIVAALERETEGIQRQHSLAKRQIALAKEFQTILIAHIVTGKLDVRVTAAGLPTEPLEVGRLNETDLHAEADDALGEILDVVLEEAET